MKPVMIKCTECNTVQAAVIEESIPFNSYVHECVNCKYVITESEWFEVNPFIKDDWIDVKDGLPECIKGEDYSKNVLAIVTGYDEIQVMCLTWTKGEDENGNSVYGPVWTNCYGDINCDEPEWDDNYEVTHWRNIPLPPKPKS